MTTATRTAFDLGRRGPLDQAIAHVDALFNATGIDGADVAVLAARHGHTRGLRQLETVLALADGGSESPRETGLRLVVVRGGLPQPQTQLVVHDERGMFVARLDLGWRDLMVAVEYDGEQHRTDRRQHVRDVARLEMLERLGWIVVRVLKEDTADRVLMRVRDAIDRQRLRLRPAS